MLHHQTYLSGPTLLLLLGVSLNACGGDKDRASELDSLRIVAVHSSLPYAKPGSTVTASMLLEDGSKHAFDKNGVARPVQTLWFAGCDNPAGDLYYNCFEPLHERLQQVSDDELTLGQQTPRTSEAQIAFGTSFQFQIPTDIIASRPQSRGAYYPYGVKVLFYAACAGELRVERNANRKQDYPVGCYQPGSNKALGPSDFEFGFYPVYAYEELTNALPVIQSLSLEPEGSDAVCQSNVDCDTTEHCGSEGLCILKLSACQSDKDCPKLVLKPKLDPTSIERAVSAQVPEQRAPFETTWVSYYSDFGAFEKDSRIIYDAGSGYTADYSGEWTPRIAAGTRPPPREVRLFVVVRDSRGGVNWETRDVYIE